MDKTNTSPDIYVLGRTREETRRLQIQAHLMNPSTRRMFEQAGIRAGMRVLDLGSGAGDVALLLASLVGSSGKIIGIDMNPAILETARERMRAANFENAMFIAGNIEAFQPEGEFDAIVGRNVLAHLNDPALTLRQLMPYLGSEGIMAFQEPDISRITIANSYPPCSLWEQTTKWIIAAWQYVGLAPSTGLDLYTMLLDAGFQTPHLSCEVMAFGGGPDWIGYDHQAETVRSVLPLILKSGSATLEEIALDTLAERLRAEAVSKRSVLRGPELISAWARKAPAAET